MSRQMMCDLCDRKIVREESTFKIKKQCSSYVYYDAWRVPYTRIDAHDKCVKALMDAALEASDG